VNNATAYEEYKAKVPALIRKHGGEYLVVVVTSSFWKETGSLVDSWYSDSRMSHPHKRCITIRSTSR
jgi:hypothetical protein